MTHPVVENYKQGGAAKALLRYFQYEHLRTDLQAVSRLFHGFAHAIDDAVPDGPEKTVALRKLLEAKDAAVRAALD